MRRRNALLSAPPPIAFHLTLHAHADRPLFRCRGLAWTLLAGLAAERRTEAACLLPDRLEWLLLGPGEPRGLVADFRCVSALQARRLGHVGAIWDGTDLVRPLRSQGALRGVVAWIAELPSAVGVVGAAEEYAYRVRRVSRPANTSMPRRVTAGSTAV